MERKHSNVKKALSVFLWIVGGIALLLLAMGATLLVQRSVMGSRPTPAPTAEPSATPAPTPLPDRSYDAGRMPSPAPAVDRLGLTDEEIESYGEENFAAEFWLDITPDDLSAMGCAVIRHKGLGYSYLVQDEVYHRLGEGDDGKGVLDVILCDLNYDDVPDVLYTYHFGTGADAQTKIGWFDLASRQNKLSPFSMKRDFLALNMEDGNPIVYRCERSVDESLGFSLRFVERLGEVMETGGELFLVLE